MTGTARQKSLRNLRYSYSLAKDFRRIAIAKRCCKQQIVPYLAFAYFLPAVSRKLALYKRDIAQLKVGEAVLDESDRFIYDSTTGGLFFDADGTGISEAIQVAQLSSGFELSQSGFLAVVLVLLIWLS
jgi:hypothetical protein